MPTHFPPVQAALSGNGGGAELRLLLLLLLLLHHTRACSDLLAAPDSGLMMLPSR